MAHEHDASLAGMIRLAAAYLANPEADQTHSHYANGRIRSVRCARQEGILGPSDPRVIIREENICIGLTVFFGCVGIILGLLGAAKVVDPFGGIVCLGLFTFMAIFCAKAVRIPAR